MKILQTSIVSIVLSAGFVFPVAAESLDAMRWHRRVLLVASPDARDLKAGIQRRILTEWNRQAADRDVSLVEVSGSHTLGTSDEAASLRRRFRLSADAFEVLLIGKDGHIALGSSDPISAETLQSTIDAMPMRKAGER